MKLPQQVILFVNSSFLRLIDTRIQAQVIAYKGFLW